MSFAPSIDVMTLDEVRAEIDALIARRDARGAFHPSEYWRWKDLSRMEEWLLGVPAGEGAR